MKTEYQIMEALKGFIVDNLASNYSAMPEATSLLEAIASGNVVIDSPDPDKMPKKDTFWLEFDNGTAEEESSLSDIVAMAVNIHIMCSKDTQANLQKKCWGYYSALYKLLRSDQTIGGHVGFSMLTDWNWYPQVTAKPGTVCIRCTLTLSWQKSWG